MPAPGSPVNPRPQVESFGTGPPLVLLHGWAMHSGMWGSLVAQLATRFRVHAVDLPGHGHSAPVAPYTLDAVVTAVAAAVEGGSEPLTVVGWSLGGVVALRWAHARPACVARLVVVCTTPCFVARDDWPHAMAQQTLARFGDELRASYRLTLLRFLTLQLQGSAEGRAALASLRRQLFARGEPAPVVLAEALAVLAGVDLRAEVPSIRQPTLVVAGDRDPLTPLPAGTWLAGALPNARFASIPGAAHAPFLSHPAAFAAILTAFFDER